MGLSLAKQLMPPEKMFVSSAKFTILISWSTLYTFNSLSLSLKWVSTLVTATYRNMESGQQPKTSYMMKVNGLERRPFIFIFRLDIVLHDLYQVDDFVMEIEEWK